MRAMRAIIIVMLLVPAIVSAQRGGRGQGQDQSSSPLAGLFPEQQGPPSNYVGYAFVQCGPGNAPEFHIVALQGLIPEGVPKAPPRPSIELIVPGTVDAVLGRKVTVAAKPAADNAVAMSCPVVGACAPADSGAVIVNSRTETGSLVGEFGAKWGIGAPRAGKFTAVWRDSQAKCG
jgi:hypothetical protein